MSEPITPANNPTIWYAMYSVIKESAPEVMDQFIERTAAKMELTVDVFLAEWIIE